jgi:hypothetical protein
MDGHCLTYLPSSALASHSGPGLHHHTYAFHLPMLLAAQAHTLIYHVDCL